MVLAPTAALSTATHAPDLVMPGVPLYDFSLVERQLPCVFSSWCVLLPEQVLHC